MAKKQEYGNESITSLKGADRVRKRPAVIFGSDGVEGCAHSIFEIVSNSIDEARDGHGDTINVTRCKDGSVIVEDFGRGMPVDWNNGEGRFNWELLFCEMYAGGKYGEGEDNYEFSLGLNGLGLCATQYASAWMTADIYRDGYHYHLDFKKGENVGGLQKEPYKGRRTGSIIHWKPDDEVFTDIDVPGSYYKDVLRRQAVVNAGLTLNFTDEKEKDPATGKPWHESWCYQNGIADYVAEVAGEDTLTPVFSCESEAVGRDREDQPDYKVRMSAAFCFSNKVQLLEYYHNSSWLEHGGSPEHAVRTAFVYQINKYLKEKNLYKRGESAISFQDVQDCLVYVSSSFSTRTSYENQTKKAITNKFVSQSYDRLPQALSGSVFSGKAGGGSEDLPAGAGEQAEPRARRKNAPEHQKNALHADRLSQPRAEVCGLPHPGFRPPRAVYRRGRLGYGRGQVQPGQ